MWQSFFCNLLKIMRSPSSTLPTLPLSPRPQSQSQSRPRTRRRLRLRRRQVPSFTFTLSILILLFHNVIPMSPVVAANLRFVDVTKQTNLPYRQRHLKYGGACIGDFDSDGAYDIMLIHHNECCATIHFNNKGKGKALSFSTAPYTIFRDIHSASPYIPSPWYTRPTIAVSIGGSRGTRPKPAQLLSVLEPSQSSNNQFPYEIRHTSTLPSAAAGRGRSVIFVRLRPKGKYFTDALVLNAAPRPNPSKISNRHFALVGGPKEIFQMRGRVPQGFADDPNGFGAVTDIDNDRVMEIITFQKLRVYKVTGDFSMRDITTQAIPIHSQMDNDEETRGVAAVAELDVNNDGHWDLYLARSQRGDLAWVKKTTGRLFLNDLLLINNRRKIPAYEIFKQPWFLSHCRGVTAGDFNNDGYTDVYLSLNSGSYDYIGFNQKGTGEFRFKKFPIKRLPLGAPGDMAVAVDIDGDGYLDVVVSSGDWHKRSLAGYFTLYRNTGQGCGNSVHIRVGNSPKYLVTALHAVVRMKVEGIRGIMSRRVGSPGVATSASLLDTLHFGIGRAKKVEWVLIQWTSGEKRWLVNVKAGSNVFVGKR